MHCRHKLTGEQKFFTNAVRRATRNMASSHTADWSIPMTFFSASNQGRRSPDSLEEPVGLDDTEDLPLSLDEDMPLIPDEERVIDVPS